LRALKDNQWREQVPTLEQQFCFDQLTQATKVIGPYHGNVNPTRRSWARANGPKMIAIIRGYSQAVDWIYDKANRVKAITILLTGSQMSPEIAERTYDDLLNPKDGFFLKARVSTEGF
jgi:hypothetical protein